MKRFHERDIEALVPSATAILDLDYKFLGCLHSEKDFEKLSVITDISAYRRHKRRRLSNARYSCMQDKANPRRFVPLSFSEGKLSNLQFCINFSKKKVQPAICSLLLVDRDINTF